MAIRIGPRLVVATHNNGKLREFAELLKAYVPEIVSSGELGLPAPDETGTTFKENAIIKAKAAAVASGSPALADDSGLCINALNGQPGIFSARWAEPKNNFEFAMKRVNEELKGKADRSAYFKTVLALCWPDGTCETIEGRVDGTLALLPRGNHGHGYDPIFIPNGYDKTFAEMADEQKNAISHRGIATRLLVQRFLGAAQ